MKSFHDGMKARVRVDRELLEESEVTNGLPQGCTTCLIYMHVLLLRGGSRKLMM